MNINDLPRELLCEIFLQTKPADWVYTLPHVCNAWKEAMPLVWRQVQSLEYEGHMSYQLVLTNGRTLAMTSRNFSNEDETGTNINDADFGYFIDVCGGSLKSLSIYIPQSPFWIKEETILLIGAACKSLRTLSLSGDISSLADSLTVACQDLPSLEEICITDESYVSDPDGINVSMLVGDVLAACRNLRVVQCNFAFVDPPGITVFRRLEGLFLEKLSWVTCQAASPAYVEDLLACLTRCCSSLREVQLLCEVTCPLNGSLCRRLMTSLGEEKSIESLNMGFQLLLPGLTEDGQPYEPEFYDSVDEAPWTDDFITPLSRFHRLHQLTLQSFDFSKPSVLLTLQKLAPRLTLLRLEDNYNVTESFFYGWTSELPSLKTLTIMRGKMSHVCLTEFVTKCPQLASFVVSDVDNLSFKSLVLSLREYLHTCGGSKNGDNRDTTTSPSLTVRLDTAPSFCHNEADELKSINLCGLRLVGNMHSKVEILRKCSNPKSLRTD